MVGGDLSGTACIQKKEQALQQLNIMSCKVLEILGGNFAQDSTKETGEIDL